MVLLISGSNIYPLIIANVDNYRYERIALKYPSLKNLSGRTVFLLVDSIKDGREVEEHVFIILITIRQASFSATYIFILEGGPPSLDVLACLRRNSLIIAHPSLKVMHKMCKDKFAAFLRIVF